MTPWNCYEIIINKIEEEEEEEKKHLDVKALSKRKYFVYLSKKKKINKQKYLHLKPLFLTYQKGVCYYC